MKQELKQEMQEGNKFPYKQIAMFILIGAMLFQLISVKANQTGYNTFSETNGGNNFTNGSNARGVRWNISWINPNNVGALDAVNATAVLNSSSQSVFLYVQDFGFSIPTYATITGIEVNMTRGAQTASRVRDKNISLLLAGSIVGNTKQNLTYWTTARQSAVYGGSTDTWGLSLSPSDVNDINFGVAISANATNAANTQARIDYIKMTVYYFIPPPNITLNSPINGNNYTTDSILINISASGNAQARWFYNGTGNTTYTSETTQSFPQGNNIIIAYANQSDGSINATTANFYIDSIKPNATFENPTTNASQYNMTSIWANFSAFDLNLDTLTIYLRNATAQVNSSSLIYNSQSTGYVQSLYSDPSLILLYHLDNDSSVGENATFIYDYSPNRYNGTVGGEGAKAVSDGKLNGAYNFSGRSNANDVIISGNYRGIQNMTNFTWSAWIRTSQNQVFPEECDIMSKDYSSTKYKSWYYLGTTGSIEFHVAQSTVDMTARSAAGTAGTDTWEFWTMTYDDSDKIGHIYKNGTEVTYALHTTGSGSIINDSKNGADPVDLWIGGLGLTSFYAYNGTIDEVSIFNRSLNSSEVEQLYHTSLASKSNHLYANFTGLVNGTYYLNATANDSYGNINSTETRTIILGSTGGTPPTGANYTCNPTTNYDWIITDTQVCNSTQVFMGTGQINITCDGELHLINGANITSRGLPNILFCQKPQIYYDSGSYLWWTK